MSTETSLVASKTLSRHQENFSMFLTLTNDNSADLRQGEEVILNGNLTVAKRSVGTTFPIGVVTVGGADGELVTVATVIQRTLRAIAKGGTLAAGAFVKPNGTWNAAGCPEYVAVAAGDYASAIVLSGGNVDTEIVVGFLRTPFKKDS